MQGLNQETVNLIVVIAVVHVVPFLGMSISALLVRQLGRFGFSHSWGPDAKDIELNDF